MSRATVHNRQGNRSLAAHRGDHAGSGATGIAEDHACAIISMLLDAWAAASGQPAFVTSTVEEITGAGAHVPRMGHRSRSGISRPIQKWSAPGLLMKGGDAVNDWWKTFFDQDYLRIWEQVFTEEANAKQAAELWSMLDLNPGCRLLDAPCGWGRLSHQLALRGARVVGVDQSETLLNAAEARRGGLPPERLCYLRHDLRKSLPDTGFDVACNIFTSFGYGTEEEDVAVFRSLRCALRPGGHVLVETNHRDMLCAFVSRGSSRSRRLPDGTLLIDEPDFDAISGVV